MASLNEAFSNFSIRRRYEVWFLRLGLADGSGAWWFRYLLMNPGRGGCPAVQHVEPVQVWATWFPASGKPHSFIQGFSLATLDLSCPGQAPFYFRLPDTGIDEASCRGALNVDGHQITWNLHYRSTFHVTISNKGWIGFSRTPHSDAVFAGEITLDGQRFAGDPLGFGVQGHNCGYRHRNFWTWAHAYFPRPGKPATTLEALAYEMPFGLIFRKAVLLHEGKQHVFRKLKDMVDRNKVQWNFRGAIRNEIRLHATIDGSGQSVHRLPYVKTDCSGTFEVANNSLASATVMLENDGKEVERLETAGGAVLEIVG